jgi:apolipoprotein N-acyltransferase
LSLHNRLQDRIEQLQSGWTGLLAAFVLGVTLTLAFAPFKLAPLAILSPAMLFVLIFRLNSKRSALLAFIYGLGLFGSGVSWVFVSIHNFGNMAAPLAAFAVLIFVSILSGYLAILGWLQARLQPRVSEAVLLIVVMPALWASLEWVRSWLFTGFPWLNLGYSQISWPLVGLAPWLGVYGISLAVALSAGMLAYMFIKPASWNRLLAILLALWLTSWGLGQISFTEPNGEAIELAIIQNNIPLREKWGLNRDPIIQRYIDLSNDNNDAQLIVWPEAAIPVYWHRQQNRLYHELDNVLSQGATVVTGAPEYERSEIGSRSYNSAFILNKAGLNQKQNEADHIYRKRHLVPFGEYIPIKPVFGWLLNVLHIPMSDFSSGSNGDKRYKVNGHYAAMSICYEDSFGEELIEQLPEAGLIINLSEDAWFGNSLAPHQRVQIARMRVLETGRPLVRAANTGPSLVIDPAGNIKASTPQFQSVVLRATVQPTRGATPYVRIGNAGVLIILVIMLGGVFWLIWSGSRRAQ